MSQHTVLKLAQGQDGYPLLMLGPLRSAVLTNVRTTNDVSSPWLAHGHLAVLS
jgi:hypothetical protein